MVLNLTGLVSWQPNTWPKPPSQWEPQLADLLETIFNDTMLKELENVIADVLAHNKSLAYRGHVIAIPLFCAVDALYPADGFSETVTEVNLTAGPGNSIAWQPDEVLHVKAPAGPEHPMIRVLRDGHEIAVQETQSLDVQLPGPGRYRAEAYLRQPGLTGWRRWTLWVFANPVYVTSPKAASTAAR